jgi:hypothetical protein
MPLKSTYWSKTSLVDHECGRYGCPLLFPEVTATSCPINHKNWAKGGCTTTMPTSIGARLRYQLDRHTDTYKALYNQRTANERINAQAKAFRPPSTACSIIVRTAVGLRLPVRC